MKPELAQTLAMLAAMAEGSADPWWIIGSAALALHGRDVSAVKDVDLLMSAMDVERFLRRCGVTSVRGSSDGLFRSAVFGTWRQPPVPVEAFGGFEVSSEGHWRPVTLARRQAVTVGSARLFVPAADELVRLLHLFGRPKDLERATLLTT